MAFHLGVAKGAVPPLDGDDAVDSPDTFLGVVGEDLDDGDDFTNGLRTAVPPRKLGEDWMGTVRMELDCDAHTARMYVSPGRGATRVEDATELHCTMRGLPDDPLRLYLVVYSCDNDDANSAYVEWV